MTENGHFMAILAIMAKITSKTAISDIPVGFQHVFNGMEMDTKPIFNFQPSCIFKQDSQLSKPLKKQG